MCDPVIGAAMALSAGGAMLNAREQNRDAQRAAAARSAAANAEFERQKKFQEEAQPVFQGAFDANTPEANLNALNAAKVSRNTALQTAAPQASEYAPAPDSASAANSEIARRTGQAAIKTADAAKRTANLGAWGDVGFKNRTAIARGTDRLGTVGNMAAGSFRLLPYEQEIAARNAMKGSSGFGDLLQLAGTGLGMAGMMGWSPSFFNATTIPAPGTAMSGITPPPSGSWGLY